MNLKSAVESADCEAVSATIEELKSLRINSSRFLTILDFKCEKKIFEFKAQLIMRVATVIGSVPILKMLSKFFGFQWEYRFFTNNITVSIVSTSSLWPLSPFSPALPFLRLANGYCMSRRQLFFLLVVVTTTKTITSTTTSITTKTTTTTTTIFVINYLQRHIDGCAFSCGGP